MKQPKYFQEQYIAVQHVLYTNLEQWSFQFLEHLHVIQLNLKSYCLSTQWLQQTHLKTHRCQSNERNLTQLSSKVIRAMRHQRKMAAWLVYNYQPDRKSTRLNSSHLVISYAVFFLKKKKHKKKKKKKKKLNDTQNIENLWATQTHRLTIHYYR